MDVSVLIPFRGDGDKRDRLWAYCRALWEQLPVELVVGEDHPGDEPFNVARAFNDAASKATGEMFVLFGADQLPDLDQIVWAMQEIEQGATWCPLFANTGAYREMDTGLILNGSDPSRFDFSQWAPFCTGIIAVTREAWAEVNGMDERFFGWGCEDTALRISLETILGPAPEPTGTLRCLWHPAAPRDRFNANAAMIGAYETAAAAGRDAMLELVAGNRP